MKGQSSVVCWLVWPWALSRIRDAENHRFRGSCVLTRQNKLRLCVRFHLPDEGRWSLALEVSSSRSCYSANQHRCQYGPYLPLHEECARSRVTWQLWRYRPLQRIFGFMTFSIWTIRARISGVNLFVVLFVTDPIYPDLGSPEKSVWFNSESTCSWIVSIVVDRIYDSFLCWGVTSQQLFYSFSIFTPVEKIRFLLVNFIDGW